MIKWHKVGIFENENSAKSLCPEYFKDIKFNARLTMNDDGGYILYINEDYWLENCVYAVNVCAKCKEKYPNKNWYSPCGCMQADKC